MRVRGAVCQGRALRRYPSPVSGRPFRVSRTMRSQNFQLCRSLWLCFCALAHTEENKALWDEQKESLPKNVLGLVEGRQLQDKTTNDSDGPIGSV